MSDWQKLIDGIPRGDDGHIHTDEPFDWNGYITTVQQQRAAVPQKQRLKSPWRNPVIYDDSFAIVDDHRDEAVGTITTDASQDVAISEAAQVPESAWLNTTPQIGQLRADGLYWDGKDWVPSAVQPLPEKPVVEFISNPDSLDSPFTLPESGSVFITPIKWPQSPSLQMDGYFRIFVDEHGRLDVEIGEGFNMTEAAAHFLVEVQRRLGGSMPSLDPPPTISIGRHTLLKLAQRAPVTLDCGVALIDADDFPRERLTTPEVRWGDPAPEGAKWVIVDTESYARWLKWRDDRCLRFGLQPDPLLQFRPGT